MKKILLFISFLFVTARLVAQTNSSPVRLALIVESGEAATVGDILTAELTKNQNIHLLERTEIERVYREQGMSAGNKDYLKLGQVLGANGLWLFEINKTTLQTNLMARMIAVKPGVVLLDEDFLWPTTSVTEWASSVANHLNPFLPKLTVLVRDAIPISVVNLRSAIQSGESLETERQLKLLAIQRLSREKQLFVLERQRMQLLSEEKELKADDSAFWNGSYLLEGVVDQNGYSKETLTINAQLTPPKGGTAIPIEVRGSRTNFAEIINQLALKLNEALKVASTVKEWNAADEAQQYFEEAKWALKWGVLSEAQAASESSWALGRRTKESAELRIRIYEQEGRPPLWGGWPYNDPTNQAYAPDATKLALTIRALELYQQSLKTLFSGEIKSDMTWDDLGFDVLKSAACFLRQYYFHPESQQGCEDQLADLRRLSREVVTLIESHSAYQGSLELRLKMASIKVDVGCYWLEAPEDCLEMYKQLAGAGFMDRFRQDFANHSLVGWKRNDLVNLKTFKDSWKKAYPEHISALWRGFIKELCDSTNAVSKVDGYFLAFADARPAREDSESDQFFYESAERLFRLAITNSEALAMAGLDADQLIEDIYPLIPHTWYGAPDHPNNAQVKRLYYSFRTDFPRSLKSGRMKKWLNDSRAFLSNDNQFNFDQFEKMSRTSFGPISEADAHEFLQVLEDWNKRYTNVVPLRARSLTPLPNRVNLLRSEVTKAIVEWTANAPVSTQDAILLKAVDAGDLPTVQTALEQGANVDARNGKGLTALMIATRAEREDLVKQLVQRGADVNAQSASEIGSTVLCCAAETGNLELLTYLVDHGANVNEKSKNLATPLYIAAGNKKLKAVKFLISKGANINEYGLVNGSTDHYTPLMAVAVLGDMEMTKLLIESGGEVETKTPWGETLLMSIAQRNSPSILKLLIEKGADVNSKRPTGYTALIYAAYYGRIENIKILLAAGADTTATATDSIVPGAPNYDAIAIAERQIHPEAALLIREAVQKSARTNAITPIAASRSTNPSSSNELVVTRFWKGPIKATSDLTDHDLYVPLAGIDNVRYRAGRLWLTSHYKDRPTFVYAVDLSDFKADGIQLPKGDIHQFEVDSNSLYLSIDDRIVRYSFATKAWEDLGVPSLDKPRMTMLNGRLYVSTKDSLLELGEDGKGIRILASTRRRPAMNVLDSLDLLDWPTVFAGPNGAIRTAIGKTVYTQLVPSGDWISTLELPEFSRNAGVYSFHTGIIYNYQTRDGYLNWLWLQSEQTKLELLLRARTVRRDDFGQPALNPFSSPPKQNQTPVARWHVPAKFTPTRANFFIEKEQFWLFQGGLTYKGRIKSDGRVELNNQSENHQCLLTIFQNGSDDPMVLPLKFKLPEELLTSDLIRPLGVTSDSDYITTFSLGGTILQPTPEGLVFTWSKVPGFWFIPNSELKAKLDDLKSDQLAEQLVREQKREQLEQKYHLSQMEVLSPDEKEAMINDAEFLSLDLAKIDSNHNGMLNAAELIYFDASQNGLLDSKEQEGVSITYRLLAEKLLAKLDANQNGQIDNDEFLLRSEDDGLDFPASAFPYFDKDHSQGFNLAETENLIAEATKNDLQFSQRDPGARSAIARMPQAPGFPSQSRAEPSKPLDSQQSFESSVEAYWKASASNKRAQSRQTP